MKRIIVTTLIIGCVLTALTAQTGKGLVTYTKNGVPKFIEFDAKHQPISNDPIQALSQNLNANTGISFIKISESIDKLGRKHEKYQQYYNGLKVAFCVYTVHYSVTNTIIALSGDYAPIGDNLLVIPTLNKQACYNKALSSENISNSSSIANGELLICRDFNDSNNSYHLAYQFYLADVAKYVYVATSNGDVLCNYSTIMHGDVCTRYSGMVTNMNTKFDGINYILHDNLRGGGITTYNNEKTTGPNIGTPNWITTDQSTFLINTGSDFIDVNDDWCDVGVWDNTNLDLDNAALDAHWGLQRIYDYWLTVHSRNSFDGVGGKINAYVHVAGISPLGNSSGKFANWLPYIPFSREQTAIIIGDGRQAFGTGTPPDDEPWASIDILAHEFAHGVAISAFNISPQGETAAISESLSDIWGAVVENWVVSNNLNNAATDTDKEKWTFGEEVRSGGVRSMSNPLSFNNPPSFTGHQDTYQGPGWGAVPHWDGGVMNKWFYLISDGGSGTNANGLAYNINQPTGIDKAADIMYLAMTTYFTSLTDFKDARQATLQAAKDLYGSCSLEAQTVSLAWDAVGVPVINNFSSVLACGTIDGNGNTTGIYDGSGFANIVIARPSDGGIIYSGNSVCPNTVTAQSGSHIVFKASDKIILEKGFRAESGSNLKAYIFNCNGVGNYRLDNNGNSTDTKQLITMNTKKNLLIYPNPNAGQFIIELENIEEESLIEVYDIMGNKVWYEKGKNKNKIHLTTYTKGIYLVKVIAGNKVFTEKIIYQ